MRTNKYTFLIDFARGPCMYCDKNLPGLVIRLMRPFRKRLNICYNCLIDSFNPQDPKDVKGVLERIEDYERKIAEFGKEEDGLLPQVLADSKGEVSQTEKADGRNRDKSGRFVSSAT